MEEKIKELQRGPPDELPEPAPSISPEMIQTTLKLLESQGMIHYAEGGAYIPTERGWKLLMEVETETEEIVAYGHPLIKATHTTTFEITKASEIKENADCIIGVKANKACKDLTEKFKDALKEARKIEIKLEADDIKDSITAFGSPALKLTSEEEIVVRKTDFIDDRTLAILANKSANEIKQELIEKLRNPETKLKMTLEIK